MTNQEMFRFNEEAVKSPEIQKYLDLTFQQLIDNLSDRFNAQLEVGILELSTDLNAYALSKGYEYDQQEAIDSMKDSFPDFRETIHKSIEDSTLAFQKTLLQEAK